MPRKPQATSRRRMVSSAAALLCEHGLTGTSFGDVLEHSGAPRGSIYHHFPGGKAQLLAEAVRLAGGRVAAALELAVAPGDPVAAIRAFTSSWRDSLVASDFRAGCPIAAVAVDAYDTPELAQLAAEAFIGWQASLARLFRRSGIPPARAQRLAWMSVASVEGAIVVCRARRDTHVLDDVERELTALIRSAIGV